MCTDTPYGRMMFTAEHMRKLHPSLKHSQDNRATIGLDPICNDSRLITMESGICLKDQTFPERFVEKCERWEEHDLLRRSISYIKLKGSNCGADGKYARTAESPLEDLKVVTTLSKVNSKSWHYLTSKECALSELTTYISFCFDIFTFL